MKSLIDLSSKIFDVKGLLHVEGKLGSKEEKNGCKYNFNRDIDALCFKNALARFVRTGTKEDAFDVFFCYAEIFKTFGGYSKGIDSLLDLLYQHEATSAVLLTKHRDHYSHSVYVFALGLAIFMNNKNMRDAFALRFGQERQYYNFLKYWGMAALFHDVGYPYEISFLQVLEYGEGIAKKRDLNEGTNYGAERGRLKMQYANLDGFVALDSKEISKCKDFLPEGGKDINDIFVEQILKDFGLISGNNTLDRKIIKRCLESRIINADKYMDHGYFSAVLFLKKFLNYSDGPLDQYTLDAVMAMLLHNSFYKITYKEQIKGEKYEPIHLKSQPLAYLLMLCDELQCWDRIPYGKISRTQELAWDIDIEVTDEKIGLVYYFEEGKEADTGKIKNLMYNINRDTVVTDEVALLSVEYGKKYKDKKVYDYLSDSKFIDLCKIAETINISYMEDCENAGIKGYMQNEFDALTLEYKLSNVAQAKNYVRHLQRINCFFSDKLLDYEVVDDFTEKELADLAVDEHIRWVAEKAEMGWKYGTDYADRNERERKRIHRDIIPYCDLTEDEKKKDTFPISNMVKQLAKYGIKIYRTDFSPKKEWVIAGIGHRDLTRIKDFDEEKTRGQIRSHIRKLQENFTVKAYSGCAAGADLIFAEEVLKCRVELTAVLPCPWKEYMCEHKDGGVQLMRILGQAQNVLIKPDRHSRYVEMNRIMIKECDELLAMWDGRELAFEDENGNEINRGGTYDAICRAEAARKRIVYLCRGD